MYTPGGSHSETILVVDDAEDIRRMVCAMLLQVGYRALEASDGSEALKTLEGNGDPVHLVLTDLIMPRMSGSELAKRILKIRPEMPIIFMSGYSDDPISEGIASPESLFLAKPFTATTLVEKVRQALERPRRKPRPARNPCYAP